MEHGPVDDGSSERYGTFQHGVQDDHANVHGAIDDERWRIETRSRFIGRVRGVVAVVCAFGAIGVLYAASHQSQWALTPPEFTLDHSSSAMTAMDPDVKTFFVYRDENGTLDVASDRAHAPSGASIDAWATFNDSLHQIGWSQLWVKTSHFDGEALGDPVSQRRRRREVMFAAGYAEGALTHHRIDQHYHNVYNTFFPTGDAADNQTLSDLRDFLRENLEWMQLQILHHDEHANLSDSAYWDTVGSILAQFAGLVAGYQQYSDAVAPASTVDLLMLNADGDLQDLIPVVQRNRNSQPGSTDPDPVTQEFYYFLKNLKCSALIRILPGFSDLVWGHATWDTYASMNRIFKHYVGENCNAEDLHVE